MEPTAARRAELVEAIRKASQAPYDPPNDNGSNLPDAPPIPKAGQQVIAVAFTKALPKTRA